MDALSIIFVVIVSIAALISAVHAVINKAWVWAAVLALCSLLLPFCFVLDFILNPKQAQPREGRFDVSVHYEDNSLKVYTILDTIHCKNYIAIPNGGIEFLEVNKPCLNKKQKRNQ